MSEIEYPIDALIQAANAIDADRLDACADGTSNAQQLPHYHHDYMLQNITDQFYAILDKAYSSDKLASVNQATIGYIDNLQGWNKLVRQLYNEYYKIIAQTLRDAASDIAEIDDSLTIKRGHNSPYPS